MYFNLHVTWIHEASWRAPSLTSLIEYNGDHKCLGNTCMCHVPHFVKAFILQFVLWRVKTSPTPQYLKHTYYNDNQWKLVMLQSPHRNTYAHHQNWANLVKFFSFLQKHTLFHRYQQHLSPIVLLSPYILSFVLSTILQATYISTTRVHTNASKWKKGKNFKDEEESKLCQSFLHVIQDSIVSNK